MFGDFTLASGKKSKYYLDSKKIMLRGDALFAYANFVARTMYAEQLHFDTVGGPETGAIPLAAVIAVRGVYENIESFYIRKQPKGHGSTNVIEGIIKPGAKVLLVEDVVTTGDSVLRVAKIVEEAGGEIVKIIAIVDRLEGAGKNLQGYNYKPILTVADLGIEV